MEKPLKMCMPCSCHAFVLLGAKKLKIVREEMEFFVFCDNILTLTIGRYMLL